MLGTGLVADSVFEGAGGGVCGEVVDVFEGAAGDEGLVLDGRGVLRQPDAAQVVAEGDQVGADDIVLGLECQVDLASRGPAEPETGVVVDTPEVNLFSVRLRQLIHLVFVVEPPAETRDAAVQGDALGSGVGVGLA